MDLISSTFKDGETIPDRYTCSGENINPPLELVDIPTNCKSLVLILDDPDAPGGSFIHWIVYNIDPSASKIEENIIQEGSVVGQNGLGKIDYAGPCPPSGIHHYFFKAFALDVFLDLGPTDWSTLERAMERHIIDKAELMGTYEKTVRG